MMSDSNSSEPVNASTASAGGFSLRFGQLLDALNISQNEFARQLGSTSAFVSNMATGKSKPGLDYLQKIAETFDVSLDWLVLGKGTLRGKAFLDPDGHHFVFLRLTLAQLAAAGDTEARRLVNELLGDGDISKSVSPARQALLDELVKRTQHGPILAMLYNHYISIPDADQHGEEVLRMALQQFHPSRTDPLANLLQAAKPSPAASAASAAPPAPPAAPTRSQIQVGISPRMAGRDYYEK